MSWFYTRTLNTYAKKILSVAGLLVLPGTSSFTRQCLLTLPRGCMGTIASPEYVGELRGGQYSGLTENCPVAQTSAPPKNSRITSKVNSCPWL